MRAVPVLFLILAGAFFILARDFYSRFVFSLVRQVPTMKKRERTFLRSMPVVSVCFGVAFIILGVLMAMNLVFPW
jgi:sterol desaturase/sphingolipid hydroxylase (fatty acid hydroxylase superfamily)